MKSGALKRFRVLSWLEGSSFLLLLFVAMPLKYAAGWPLGVRVVGMAHGLLFILYVASVLELYSNKTWTIPESARALVASVVPFGMVWLDRRLRADLTTS